MADRWGFRIVLAVGLCSVLATSACGEAEPPPRVPAVAGLQLDDAHNVLKDAGYKKFDDVDALADRTPMWDANWAVVKQVPEGGLPLAYDDVVQLEVMKKDDTEIRSLLKDDSPVLSQILQRDADREKQQQEEEQRRAKTANKPLDCSKPTFEITSETWQINAATGTSPARFMRGDVKVVITNESEHKIATAGIVFSTAYHDPNGRTRSTRELGGYALATAVVPEQSRGRSEWETLGPYQAKEFKRTFRVSSEQYE
ncbi:PASTA domain-containing protein, partial [Prescottella equi]